ncbi:MAG: hypothetical protein KBD60_14125 [Sterolibacterium sp.]|nr:hypothetical protein [Sterolibacterium sp.]
MKNWSDCAPFSPKMRSSASFGHRCERGLSLSLPSWPALRSDLKPSQKWSDSSPGSELMTKATQLLERMMWFWIILLVVSIGQIIWWSIDRDPPFRVDAVRVTNARQGGLVHIDAEVFRDVRRDCGVTLSSHIYDSTGVQFVLDGSTMISSSGISELERKSPGKLRRTVKLPDGVAVGPASIVSSMTYTCNPMQEILRPIQVQTEFQFEVLP